MNNRMKDRMAKAKRKVKQHAPWLLVGGGVVLILASSYKAAVKLAANIPDYGTSMLVLEEVPPHEAGGDTDVYADLDNPGMYYKVRAL